MIEIADKKVKWSAKRPTLPQTLLCNGEEAIQLLRRQLFDDAIKHGWLVHRCEPRPGASKIYAVADVQLVATRVLNGEYPGRETKKS